MKNILTTVIGGIEAIGIAVLVKLYIMMKSGSKDKKEKFNKLEARITSLEKTIITKKELNELLKLHLGPINEKLNDISITKIK